MTIYVCYYDSFDGKSRPITAFRSYHDAVTWCGDDPDRAIEEVEVK